MGLATGNFTGTHHAHHTQNSSFRRSRPRLGARRRGVYLNQQAPRCGFRLVAIAWTGPASQGRVSKGCSPLIDAVKSLRPRLASLAFTPASGKRPLRCPFPLERNFVRQLVGAREIRQLGSLYVPSQGVDRMPFEKIVANAEDRPIFHQPKGDAERGRVHLRRRRELKKGPGHMRKFIKMTATVATIAIPLSTAVAGDSNGAYIMYGVGGLPCHAFITAMGTDRDKFVNWLGGFLTASNAFLSDTKDITPGAGTSSKFLSIVWKQCRAFHDTQVSDAAITIATRLHDRLIANPNKNPYEGED